MNTGLKEKLCFIYSTVCFATSIYCYAVRPSIILYLFSFIFIFSMVARVVDYWRSKYILFMFDLCYTINTLSLIMVWAFPDSLRLRYVQFGLANTHAYWGSFLYRNSLVFHDFQKLVSAFIHILPVVFSFLLRWFPIETSVWWYTSFLDTKAKAEVLVWMNDRNWLYQFLVPLVVFIVRESLYYLIIYGCVKPGEEHLDSFRYMHTKKFLAILFWNRFDGRWHLIIWIMVGIMISALSLCLAVIAWSSYLCHCIMLALQLLVICWNGASYYIDYYPIERQRLSNTGRNSYADATTDQHHHNSDPVVDAVGNPSCIQIVSNSTVVPVLPNITKTAGDADSDSFLYEAVGPDLSASPMNNTINHSEFM